MDVYIGYCIYLVFLSQQVGLEAVHLVPAPLAVVYDSVSLEFLFGHPGGNLFGDVQEVQGQVKSGYLSLTHDYKSTIVLQREANRSDSELNGELAVLGIGELLSELVIAAILRL